MATISQWQGSFGARLKRLRTIAGWSQQGLAKVLSVDRSLVSRWESGEREPGLWEVVRAAQALGVPVSELVLGATGLPHGGRIVWKELAYRGVPFVAAETTPLWAVRPIHESVADALLHPEPRVIDRLPGLLLAEDFPPHAVWGLCTDYGVDRRLGWIADIARTLAQLGSAPNRPLTRRAIDVLLERVSKPSSDTPYDSLGFGAEQTERLPPASKRWRISYAQTIEGFEAAAEELAEIRLEGVGR